ncbi:hybrid sensor histidine kinase/response regulator transcription factor [Saccharicrinis aurantiacus]|uniref:hybrid sensor histidine kinase/response regulator transcription factor n=1 Tax=Saccharicrinis aurantiacus TaxID=1849719 RepID=UPI00094FB504|nr:ATP-binding protein [Saccharicrinis aurantiacus]
MRDKYFLAALLILSFSIQLIAKTKELVPTTQLTISNGLSHNGVSSLLEDSRGFIWIGTFEGLNKYDGYKFTTYKNTIHNKLLTSNRVRTLAEDEQGNILIGSDEGLMMFDYDTSSFKNIYTNKKKGNKLNGPIIRRIIINPNSDHIICTTEKSGILLFDKSYNFIKQYSPLGVEDTKQALFHSGIALDADNYVITCNKGLFLFNVKTEKFTRVLGEIVRNSYDLVKYDNKLIVSSMSGVFIMSFIEESGSYQFKFKSKAFSDYQLNFLSIDKVGNLWMSGLSQGIIHVKNCSNFTQGLPYQISRFKPKNSLLRMSQILPNTSYGCWAASYNKGLYRFNLQENPFHLYNTEVKDKYGLKANNVTSVARLDQNRIFLTASRGGLALFNVKRNRFEPLPFAISEKESKTITSVYVDSRRDIWLKFNNKRGFCRVRHNSKELEQVKCKDGSVIPSSYRVYDFQEDRRGHIWFVSMEGTFRISVNRKGTVIEVESISDNPVFKDVDLGRSRALYMDPHYDFLWIGTHTNGIIRVDVSTQRKVSKLKMKQFKPEPNNPNSLSSAFVSSFVRLPNKEFWVGTEGGGVCKVIDSETEATFVPYTEKNGLSNNVVKSILYDAEYNLWIATNIGLNKFDTKDRYFRKFNVSDGLPFEDFWYASDVLDNGLMLFSGMQGLCYFKPSEIPQEDNLPKLELTNIKILNQDIHRGDTINDRVLFDQPLNKLNTIELKDNENFFSFEFTSLHFSNFENYHIKYQLSPVNDEWVEVPSNQRQISYSALPAGDYILRVSASNTMGLWTDPIELNIKVLPPFWKSNLALMLYFVVFTLIFIVVFVYAKRLQSLKHNLELEQFEKDKVKEVNTAKLQFFSNISHEIKTPLTLISGPIDILVKRFQGKQDIADKLVLVQRQAKKISQLVDQVHDFQRSDANQLIMNSKKFEFNTFIHGVLKDFEFMATSNQKVLKAKGPKNEVTVFADQDKLEKIFNNLLNNAFKFTKSEDEITIEYRVEGKRLIVAVTDTGKGIHADDVPFIFERFFQSRKENSEYTGGSGIGLAFSKRLAAMHYGDISVTSTLGEGTSFVVDLPIVSDALEQGYLEAEEEIIYEDKQAELKESKLDLVDVSNIKLEADLSDITVFFAEDNVDMRDFVVDVLSHFFIVKGFENGQACLDAMKSEWPDIVVSDVLMPEMNGFDLCKNIKSDIKTSHIPVILLTASTAMEDQIKGIKNGADSYIKKPFNAQHLVSRIESLLKNRKQLRERFQIDFPLTLKKEEGTDSNDQIFLEKLYGLFEKNLDNQDLDLNSFAKELYLNRTHFYQKVKALTDSTPFEMMKKYRISKAAEFLVQQGLSVNEVYIMTGFKSRAHFSKLFKERYGVTPGKYASEAAKKYTDNPE